MQSNHLKSLSLDMPFKIDSEIGGVCARKRYNMKRSKQMLLIARRAGRR